MIDASHFKVGDVCRWERSSRRFVVFYNDGFKIECRYLDTGEMFHTEGFQSIFKIEIDWWMGALNG